MLLSDAEKEQNTWLRWVSIFALILSVFILFQRKHMRNMRFRTRQILDTNKNTQALVLAFREHIEMDQKEIEKLENLLKEPKVENTEDQKV